MAGRVKGARDKVLADFADNVVRLAQINVGKTYTAKNYILETVIYNFEGYYENQKLKSNLFNKRYG